MTHEADTLITERYPAMGAAWCARRLGLTGQQVQRRAAQLGVKRALHHGRRLTDQRLRELRADCAKRRALLAEAAALSPRRLAPRYGIHEAHIRAIEKGRRYKEPA